MAGFDPDVFGAPPAGGQSQGFDAEIFSAPVAPQMIKAPTTSQKPKDFNLRGEGYDRVMNYSGRDALAGEVRGAASIGATLLRPFESADENAARRAALDPALTSLVGSDPNSMAYKTNKLIAEVGGTSGAGGLIAKGLRLIPGAAGALSTLLPAIETGGMTANGVKGVYGMANRVAGGAVNGASTAGLVNPEDADTGGIIGALTPPVLNVAGKAGAAIGDFLRAKPINPTLQQTAKESIEAGYVIPPNMVAPSFGNRVLESVSGKQATQQLASTKNTAVTEGLVRDALGIPAGTPLSQGTLDNLRKTAGKAYADVSSLSPQAATDLEALKVARNESQAWFKAYNRSASPLDLAKAKQLQADAAALEQALEGHAQSAGRPDLIPALRDARKQIAKTYTVGRALNDAAGTVDARVLGRMYEKGVPLSDGLDVAGKFASAFPKVAISPQQIGSPAAHNLSAWLAAGLGGGGAASGAALGLGVLGTGGLGAVSAAVPFVAPSVARSIMFSSGAQRGLTAPVMPGLLGQIADESAPLVYRSGGLLATSP